MTVQHDLTVSIPATTSLIPAIPTPKKKGRGRPPIQHDNHFVRLWLHRWLDLDPSAPTEYDLCILHSPSIYQLPGWCHDVIVGAARLNNSDKHTGLPLNTSTIIRILLELDVLSNASVKEYVESMHGKEISRQYGQLLTSAAITASKSIDYYLEKLEAGESIR